MPKEEHKQDTNRAPLPGARSKEEPVPDQTITILTDANFDREVSSSEVPLIVDFWAPWCAPCRMVSPVIEEIAADHAGALRVGKLNVDDNPVTASKFGIMSIPTIMLFRDGKAVKKVIGARGKRDFEREFDLA